MTNPIPNHSHWPHLESSTYAAKSLDSALEKLQVLENATDLKAAISEVRADLLKLKDNLTSSDFKSATSISRANSLQKFIDAFPSILGYWDRNLKNVHCNVAYATYFGKFPEEIRGRTIMDLLGEKIFNLNLGYINNVLLGKPQTFERELPCAKGGTKMTLGNYVPHFVNDKVVGFFVLVTDISEKKQLEEKADKLEATLHEQSRLSSLGQMASGIAHEINNPLAIIYCDTCLLLKEFKKENPKTDYILEKLTEIESTSLRIEKIVDGLRSLSNGRPGTTATENNVSDIIDQVLSISENRFRSNSVAIIWKKAKDPIFAMCNPTQVSEILLNLLNNAFDEVKSLANGTVTIEVSRRGDKCEIQVSNNGAEISPQQRLNLFVPFYTTKGSSGTGLGLKISRDLAHANLGDLILAEQEKTAFILTLPSSDTVK